MFNIFKKKVTAKYLVHHIGTSDVYTACTDKELNDILAFLGDEAEVTKLKKK